MVSDPYEVLGVPASADDETIRRRYLELVREFSPDRFPDKFAAIRAAYDATRDLTTRVRSRLFDTGKREALESLIEEMACRTPRQRVSLETLLQVTSPRS
jgi:DnaJ-class molecular chaperone